MSTYQRVVICGNLGDNPNMHQFENGGLMAQLSVATTEHWRDKNTNEKMSRTEWHRIIVNGKRAETIEKYCKKGDKLLVEGKLRTRKWTDSNGADKYTTEIVCDNFTFMSSKGSGSDSQPQQAQSQKPTENFPDPNPGDDDHDDLPF